MESKFIRLEDGDIAVSLPNHILKLQDLEELAKDSFESVGLENIRGKFHKEGRGNFPVDHPEFGRKAWLGSGIDAEILQPSSKGWRKGRVRFKISLEFQAESTATDAEQTDGILNALRKDT